jgi:hypothetical protein
LPIAGRAATRQLLEGPPAGRGGAARAATVPCGPLVIPGRQRQSLPRPANAAAPGMTNSLLSRRCKLPTAHLLWQRR